MGNALGVTYFRTTSYRLGPHAIKFSLAPHVPNGGNVRPGDEADFLGQRFAEHLRDNTASFDFRVLVQTDPGSMPVEDPTVDWAKASAATTWSKVATIHLPAQVANSKERMTLAENMAFTPWNTLDAHRPLDGINRARWVVYAALSTDRFPATDPTVQFRRRSNCAPA